MRITKNQLRQIIKEELGRVLGEARKWEASPEDKAAGISHYERNPMTLGQRTVYEPSVITGDRAGSDDEWIYGGIKDRDTIEVGQVIYDPVSRDEYTVKAGDNLTKLASAWGTDIDSIMDFNQPDAPIDGAPKSLAKESRRRRKTRRTRRK